MNLNGNKTYVCAALMFVIGGLLYTNIITQEQANSFAIMVSGLFGASLRSAIKKVE